MLEADPDRNKKLTAPYPPFQTFLTALDHLKAIGIPNIVDRGVFPSLSGLLQGQLIGALKFLRLIDESGKPRGELLPLCDNERRKSQLLASLKASYPDLIALDLTKVSPSQFDKQMELYNVSGTTHQKAKSFFLKAAQFAELPLSPLLTRKTRISGARRKKAENRDQNGAKPPLLPSSNTAGTSRTINLKSGGQLVLTATVDLFNMSEKDRTFVFGIIDQIQKYETASDESGLSG